MTFNRRVFLRGSAIIAANLAASGESPGSVMRLGVIAQGSDPEAAIGRVRQLGFTNCQVHLSALDRTTARRLRGALEKFGIEATSLIITGPGPEVYDFLRGPSTIGLVPREYRAARLARMKQGSEFAKIAGIPGVQAHCGFIPENPNDPLFEEVVLAIREIASCCKQNGQTFRCETGQETPITLLRAIRAVGLGSLGVNFDVGNLILYGKANPLDALDILGPYVLGVHVKDGLYPTDPNRLGLEAAIGKGRVDFRGIIQKLKAAGYRGPITIEREISGPEQDKDIRASKLYLEKLIG
jgi:L-ribulose-5-phosphate 3-epimerase